MIDPNYQQSITINWYFLLTLPLGPGGAIYL